jgi:hypothetical protein
MSDYLLAFGIGLGYASILMGVMVLFLQLYAFIIVWILRDKEDDKNDKQTK